MGDATRYRVLPSALMAGLIWGCAGAPKPDPAVPKAMLLVAPLEVRSKLVLQSERGLQIVVVNLAGDEALLRVTGMGGVLDGKVLRARMERQGLTTSRHRMVYRTAYRGRPYALLFGSPRTGENTWFTMAPEVQNVSQTLRPVYDAKALAAVDAAALQRLHQEQKASGALDFQRYERKWWVADSEDSLVRARRAMKASCGKAPPARIDWPTISDARIRKEGVGITTPCFALVDTLARVCQSGNRTLKDLVGRLESIRCELSMRKELSLEGKTLFLRSAPHVASFMDMVLAIRLPSGKSLRRAMMIDATDICLQGEHRIFIAPPKRPSAGMLIARLQWMTRELSYGKGGRLVAHGPLGSAIGPKRSCQTFLDPRFVEARKSGLYSRACVAVDRQAKQCILRCGAKSKTLPLGDRKLVEDISRSAKFEDSPLRRLPHALARDRRGTYYYVDRARGRNSRDFRVFIGRRGRMKQQKMVDVVSDSEGQIFETKRGRLRLIFSKSLALWIVGKRSKKLTLVPTKKNLPLIYRELGVYWGKRLGTPCDDF